MDLKLYHNKILENTVSEGFVNCVENTLIPMLRDKYPNFESVYMYEDHISRELKVGTSWYYPFTVNCGEEPFTEWVKWTVSGDFEDGIPYSFTGEGTIDFAFAADTPKEFKEYMKDRSICRREGALPFSVISVSNDPTFLSGKYSQGFVDELACQITEAIARAMSVEGLAASEVELQLVFDGATYMEHTSENVTYRRLLISDNTGRARDFWVKWTRLDGVLSFTVTDNVTAENIRFELGEDVSQKIREKEYRFLCRIDPDKYQSSMGKKTVTEWREVIKRCVRRGTLLKVERVPEISEHAEILSDKLAEILRAHGVKLPEPEIPLEAKNEDTLPHFDYTEEVNEEENEAESTPEEETALSLFETEDEPVLEESTEAENEPVLKVDVEVNDLPVFEQEPVEVCEYEEEVQDDTTEKEEMADVPLDMFADLSKEKENSAVLDETLREKIREEELKRIQEEQMRAKVEAEVRLEYESRARAKAEADLLSLRADVERLLAENERLTKLNLEAEQKRRAEEEERLLLAEREREEQERLRLEESRRVEEERIARAELEEKLKGEELERARLSELARAAVEEQRRIERERAEREAAEREEVLRLERERALREEEARERERERLEKERIENEQRRIREEEERYVTKHAKLIFRNSVDLNVMKRIQEIAEETLVLNNKEHIHIHMKAYPADATTIHLEILKMPRNETELLVSIIKAIGNGKLGISKITLE